MNIRKTMFSCRMTIFIMLFFSSSLFAQPIAGFTIDGKIEGLQDGEKVLLRMVNSNSIDQPFLESLINTDSTYAKDGKFHISGKVPDGPRHYLMYFDKHQTPAKIIELFIDNNENIRIESGDMNKINHNYIQHYVKIEGSLTNYGMMCLNPVVFLYHQSMSRLNRCIRKTKDSIGFSGAVVEAYIKSKDEINEALLYNLLAGDRDPEIEKASLFLSSFLFLKSGHSSIWPTVYNMLSDADKKSFYGKLLSEKTKISVGQIFPDFTLLTSSGKSLNIKEIIGKNKITIVHFWAKNSIDRGEYQSELLALYKKYKSKGLEIVGYSTDNYKDEWLETLTQEKFPWLNVGEQKGINGLAKQVYHEYSTDFDRSLFIHNTTNVVLDSTGKILAWDVRGAELQYYLWKALGD